VPDAVRSRADRVAAAELHRSMHRSRPLAVDHDRSLWTDDAVLWRELWDHGNVLWRRSQVA